MYVQHTKKYVTYIEAGKCVPQPGTNRNRLRNERNNRISSAYEMFRILKKIMNIMSEQLRNCRSEMRNINKEPNGSSQTEKCIFKKIY